MSHANASLILYGAARAGVESNGLLVRIDPSTGAVTPIGSGIGFESISGIDIHPVTGELYASGQRIGDPNETNVLIRIDKSTGVGTEIGPTGLEGFRNSVDPSIPVDIGVTHSDLSFRSDGSLFGWSFPSLDRPNFFGALSKMNLLNGSADLIGFATGVKADNGSALAFDLADSLLYAGGENPTGRTCSNGWGTPDCDDVLHDVAFDEAAETVAASIRTLLAFPNAPPGLPSDVNPRPAAMDFDPIGGTLFAIVKYGFSANSSEFLATIDPDTGGVELIGLSGFRLDGIAAERVPVPEPASLALLAVALVVLLARRSGRRSTGASSV